MNRKMVEQQLGETKPNEEKPAVEQAPAMTPKQRAEQRLQLLQSEQQELQSRLQQLRQATAQLEQALLVNLGAVQETGRVLEWLTE